MNISIRKQLTVIFVGLMSIMFLASFVVNTFFLEDFYYVRKEEVLMNMYSILNENISPLGRLEESEKHELEQLCNANNISFVVTDQNYQKLIWADQSYLEITLARLNGYGIGIDFGQDILVENEDYTIQKKYDSQIGITFLEMWGRLDQGFPFIMRINAENISDSVSISNEFLKYICLVGIVLTMIMVWFISSQVTKPLRELTELSKRMADLDFDAKFTGGGNNEVGQLGAHFNMMSEKLQTVYSQLLTANNELQKDIEKKEKIDDMRKEFLSNVSHELKTPIALIQGYAEGLQECVNDDPESRAFYCDVIMDEAAKMNGLVQKLLTLNQLEFGNDKVTMERFDLAGLLKNKIQSVSILVQQKEAQISCDCPDTIFVWGDEFKVEEVLTNYLSNALNHVSGERKIRVTAEPRGEQVRVTVFNTGECIPETDIGLIWDKFYKVDKARTREYGGSGVGLSIVKAIMESFHQKYGVENRTDGVAFWFELQSGSSTGEQKLEPFRGDSADSNA